MIKDKMRSQIDTKSDQNDQSRSERKTEASVQLPQQLPLEIKEGNETRNGMEIWESWDLGRGKMGSSSSSACESDEEVWSI